MRSIRLLQPWDISGSCTAAWGRRRAILRVNGVMGEPTQGTRDFGCRILMPRICNAGGPRRQFTPASRDLPPRALRSTALTRNGDGNVHCQREQAGIEGDAGGTEMSVCKGLNRLAMRAQLPPKKPAAIQGASKRAEQPVKRPKNHGW